MKKAKLLLFLVMILAVASMLLFACGDKDAHDCKDENFDHNCDVCEKVLSACKDEDNDEFCNICNEYIGCLSFRKNQDNTYSVSGFSGSPTDVIIPSTYKGLPVTSIGYQAFYNCKSLTNVVIEDGVKSIGNFAFDGCTSLTSVVIPSSVTSIGSYAFYDCTSLTSIVIPSSVTSIGDYAFSGCWSLIIYCEAESEPSGWGYDWNCDRPVVWGYDASNLKIIDGVCYYIKDGSAMVTGRNANVTNVTILSTIENNGVTYSVTSIGDNAFRYCKSLTSIVIPSSVTSIGGSAFSDCTSLASIVIPSSVTSIGEYAFYFCLSLTIYCEAESEPSGWHYSWNYGGPVVWGYDASNLKIIDGVYYYIKDGSAMVTGLNANVTNVTILSTIENNGVTYSVTSIGVGAFSYCTSLTSIVIPSSVTSIGEYAFLGCTSLTIYCEAESAPSGWDSSWNRSRPVVWGYSKNA